MHEEHANFEERFGHLPEEKQRRIYMMMSMKAVNNIFDKVQNVIANIVREQPEDDEDNGWNAACMYIIGMLHKMKYTREDVDKFLQEVEEHAADGD